MSTGSWGVSQATCCRTNAQTPLLATRTSQFGPAGDYKSYYDCSAVQSSTCPPPSPPPPSLSPPPLGCATDGFTLGTKTSLGVCGSGSGLNAACQKSG
eukprot:scaffold19132_cov57-Phaeocystis_antarctica.AAC.1